MADIQETIQPKKVVHLERLAALMNEGQHVAASLPWLDLDGEDEPVRFLFNRKVEGENYGLIAEGNLHTIKGLEKAGKSAMGLLLIVASLRGSFLGIEAARPALRILWIDTEQDRATLRQKGHAVLDMAGLEKRPDNLLILTLRGESVPDRLAFTIRAIRETAPDLVFLDGAVDLCLEFNDEKASRAVVNELTADSEKYGAAILCVIHTNRQKENIDNALKARGHLGTLLQQKSAEIYQVNKDRGEDRAEVKLERSRFAPVPDFAFKFTDGFRLDGVGGELSKAQLEKLLEMHHTFGRIFGERSEMRRKDILKAYMEQENCSQSTASNRLGEAVKKYKIISQTGDGLESRYRLVSLAPDLERMAHAVGNTDATESYTG